MNELTAIICEYNPFHMGHLYHLEKARRNGGGIVCIMSGEFVQRAEPAVCSPFVRARAAVMCGADAVIGLPAIFATAAGAQFASGAVRIAAAIPSVKFLAMGCEDDDEKLLTEIAKAQCEESPEFKQILAVKLQSGVSYASAYTYATAQSLPDKREKCAEVLTKPNNLLAVEYIKSLLRCGRGDIKPILIKRKGSDYHSLCGAGDYISASAARELMERGDYTALSAYIPPKALSLFMREAQAHPVDRRVFEALTVDALRRENLSELPDAAEGLDVKLKECALACHCLQDVILAAKSKRYTLSRIRRLCVQALLGIKKGAYDSPPAARLLAVSQSMRSRIGELGAAVQNSELPGGIDLRASRVYSLITSQNGDAYYDTKLQII